MRPPDPDQDLITRAKNKDKEAFVALFDKYKDKIFGYLQGYLKDYEKARDVTLQTFMIAYETIDAFKGTGKFSSWLYAIATNTAKKEFRKKAQLKEVSLETPIDAEGAATLGDLLEDEKNRPDYAVKIADLRDFIFSMLSRLDEKYREVLLLCDLQDMSYEEASAALGCNPITVGTRLRRARRMLYVLLKRYKTELY